MTFTTLLVLAALPVAPVKLQTGVQTPPLVGATAQAALRFAASRSAEYGQDPRSTLVPGRQLSTRFGGTVHLVQQVDGLDVHGARLVVTFDALQRVVRVSSSLKRFSEVKTGFAIGREQALVIASREVDGALLQPSGAPYGGTTRRAFVVNGALHAGYLTFVPTLKNSESWHVAVDATDGAVLWARNQAHAADAARVYASSPGAPPAGVGVTPVVDVTLTDLLDGGVLRGNRVRALNCCPTENCQPDAGPLRATGTQQTFNGTVDFDVAICHQVNRASNDPAVHPSGDWVYAPVDPPGTPRPSIANPADYDEFAEVHGYHHAVKTYDVLRALSTGPLATAEGLAPFAMRRSGAGADVPTVWVNVSDSDFQSATQNAQGVYVSDTLSRTDNAMFLARENMEFLLLPPQVLASDALVMYQGQAVDFAYDGPVLWHEFGHGAIYSTADWDTVVTLDSRSANNESSALHEGVSDLIAVMVGNDPVVGSYVGPRLDPASNAIRDVNNQEKCPDVLWGESHQDSLHFTGAVYEARTGFLGSDQGATFDAALYAALVSFPPDVGFESAAAIVTDMVVQAFPQVSDARARMTTIFDARGVTNCSKVLDLTDSLAQPRTYFGISGTSFAGLADNTPVPGPYQFKVRVPNGAKAVSMSGPYGFGGGGGATTARLELLGAVNRPISFARQGTVLANDAQARVVPSLAQGRMSARLALDVPCGGELHFAVANTSRRDRTLYELQFAVEPADSCPEPVVDAGAPEPEPVTLVATREDLGPPVQGCGCGVSPAVLFLVGAVALLLRRRRSPR